MKTITLCRNDARRFRLPVGTKVQIELSKNKHWKGCYEVYYKGEFLGTFHLEQPNGAGR